MEDLFKAIVSWAVPLVGAWLLTKIPAVKKWLEEHPFMRIAGVSLLLAILCSISILFAYEKYVVAPRFAELQTVLFGGSDTVTDGQNNTCPPGSYAVGVRTVSVSGGAHGFLESATIRCQELKFKKK